MSSNVSSVHNKSPVTRGNTRIRYLVFMHRFMTLCAFRGRDNNSSYAPLLVMGSLS